MPARSFSRFLFGFHHPPFNFICINEYVCWFDGDQSDVVYHLLCFTILTSKLQHTELNGISAVNQSIFIEFYCSSVIKKPTYFIDSRSLISAYFKTYSTHLNKVTATLPLTKWFSFRYGIPILMIFS